jgi:transcriptional regulator with XRE-family HTH domain
MSHRNYLSLHRKRWALSQRELALLLGHQSRSVVSRLELGKGRPSLPFVLRCETVFGVGFAELFPDLADETHEVVMRQAAQLDLQVRGCTDAASARKRTLLLEMVERVPKADLV